MLDAIKRRRGFSAFKETFHPCPFPEVKDPDAERRDSKGTRPSRTQKPTSISCSEGCRERDKRDISGTGGICPQGNGTWTQGGLYIAPRVPFPARWSGNALLDETLSELKPELPAGVTNTAGASTVRGGGGASVCGRTSATPPFSRNRTAVAGLCRGIPEHPSRSSTVPH